VLRSIQLYNALSAKADEQAACDLIEAAGPHGSGAAPLLRIAPSLEDAHSEDTQPKHFSNNQGGCASRL